MRNDPSTARRIGSVAVPAADGHTGCRPVPPGSPAPPVQPAANPNQETNSRDASRTRSRAEPAEQVFKNIQSMKGVPAGRPLMVMNRGYSRALGVACTHCHVEQDFSSDDKRPKRAAREMMAMNKVINERLRTLQNSKENPRNTSSTARRVTGVRSTRTPGCVDTSRDVRAE
jgi:hypothetical protein